MSLPSGKVNLRGDDIAIYSSTSAPAEVCRAVYTVPTPVVVHVQATKPDRDATYATTPSDVHLFAGASGEFNSAVPYAGLAALVFEYGCGAVSRRVVSDLRSGSYALPPSERVSVALLAFAPIEENFAPDVDVAIAIAKGTISSPTRAVYTAGNSGIDNGDFIEKAVPNGARWVDFWATEAAQSATSPILTLSDIIEGESEGTPMLSAAPRLVKNYVENTVFPHGGPYELMGNTGSVRLCNDGTGVGNLIVLRFFLEF